MQTSTRKFGDVLVFEGGVEHTLAKSFCELPISMRVVGLKRKAKNGTKFHIFDTRQLGKRQPPMQGFAEVIKTSKDGKVTARLTTTNTFFVINTKDTVRWPHAVPVN